MVVQDAIRIVPGWDSAFQITSPVRRFTADLVRHYEEDNLEEKDEDMVTRMVAMMMMMTCLAPMALS